MLYSVYRSDGELEEYADLHDAIRSIADAPMTVFVEWPDGTKIIKADLYYRFKGRTDDH